MYLLLGNSYMKSGDYKGAIQSFEHARAQMRQYGGRPLLVVSLVSFPMCVSQHIKIAHRLWQISGWNFDDLDITIRQRLCDSLYAVGRAKDAGETFLKIVNDLDGERYMSGPLGKWVSGEFMFNLFGCRAFKLLLRIHPQIPLRSRKCW